MSPRKTVVLVAALLLMCKISFAQSVKIDKIEPPNWWAGMKYNIIQLMVYGENLNDITAKFDSPLLKVLKVTNAETSSYSFIDVEVSSKAKPGAYVLTLSKNNTKTEIKYRLAERKKEQGRYQGFSQKDVIYMITPDRFANGDTLNDEIPGMNDHYNPESHYGRHGGDIQGVINRLGYIKDLGATAVWLNPVVENNTKLSYHGYGVTDLYRIDPRFGTNELYIKFVDEAHKMNLKVILDHVSNHLGIFHPWVNNLPFKNWLNGSVQKHHITRHFNSTVYDIHADSSAKNFNNHGWFVDEMPDLNQQNPFLAKYLIQNTLWWIESTGLDGIREDTYPYPDQRFLSAWAETILKEYPDFNIVGEVWMGDAAFLAPFQAGSKLQKNFDTHLPALTDFGICDAARDAFKDSTTGIRKVYDALAKDYLFADPDNLVTFLDNHDMERILYVTKNNYERFKLALTLLLTTRGIPQLYYGTEIGIPGGPDHGTIRADFPGGFRNSTHNAFTQEGRTPLENDIFGFTRQLLQIRKQYDKVFGEGSLIHFPPYNELYPYLRIAGNQKILVVLNNKNEAQKLDTDNLGKHFKGVKVIKNLKTGYEMNYSDGMQIEIQPLEGPVFLLE